MYNIYNIKYTEPTKNIGDQEIIYATKLIQNILLLWGKAAWA